MPNLKPKTEIYTLYKIKAALTDHVNNIQFGVTDTSIWVYGKEYGKEYPDAIPATCLV